MLAMVCLLSVTIVYAPINAYGLRYIPGHSGNESSHDPYHQSMILDIKPVQAVWDSDINGDGLQELVDGKSTAALVYMNVPVFKGIDKNQSVKVKVLYGGVPYYNDSTSVGAIRNLSYVAVKIDPAPFKGTGQISISAIADRDHKFPELDGYDRVKSIKVNVIKTKGLKVLFVPVDGPGHEKGYSPVNRTKYDGLFNRSYLFLKAVYPVADPEVIFAKFDGRFNGSLDRTKKFKGGRTDNYTLGMDSDYLELERIGKSYGYDRVIGVVPTDYFNYHHYASGVLNNSTPGGMTQGTDCIRRGLCSVLVREDSPENVVSHELGHTFGLNLPPPYGDGEEYDLTRNPPYPGNPARGFDVSRMRPIEGICFMGSAKAPVHWVCDETYKGLFKRFLVRLTCGIFS